MAVTKAARGKLRPACVGDRINLAHEAAQAYVASKKRAKPRVGKARGGRPKGKPAATGPPDQPPTQLAIEVDPLSALSRYGNLTLNELVERHGTERGLVDWLDALKKIEDIRKANLANEETEERLIERELVSTHVFGALEALNRRLLVDSPRTIASRLYAACRSGDPIEDAEKLIRELLSAQLKPAVASATRALRGD